MATVGVILSLIGRSDIDDKGGENCEIAFRDRSFRKKAVTVKGYVGPTDCVGIAFGSIVFEAIVSVNLEKIHSDGSETIAPA